MPKGSPELTAARRNEIIDACEKLYETKSFKEITVAMIAELTSFTRASIYNYFDNKEEIFLALLQREYALWNESLQEILDGLALSVQDFAEAIASSLDDREQLLKLLSMNHYDMEEHSRIENLTEFKVEYGRSLRLVEECLAKSFPDMAVKERRDVVYTFFPELFGVYAYSMVTTKQNKAMRQAGICFPSLTPHELIYRSIKRLLP